jgi:rhodanese-related sulfurtransferase
VPAAAIMEPQELARILGSRSAEKPLIFQVGFRFLYKEAHIPGAEYLGPASKDEGLQQLRKRAASLARTRVIVLYCGCCPWIRCPNVKPAYDALRGMGFTNVKVLRLEENFGTNWVSKGYPTAHGE